MENVPIIKCPGCLKRYMEDYFNVKFDEKITITFKCDCGWELDVKFEKYQSLFNKILGKYELKEVITVRAYK